MAEPAESFDERPHRIGGWWRSLGRVRLSRLIRWGIALGLGWWVYTNYFPDQPLHLLIHTYAYPESRFIAVGGMEVHLREVTPEAQEPRATVLLLHDENSSLHTWAAWTDSLARQRYRVIAVDLPGFGLTGPHPQGSYSLFMYANFLEQLVDSLALKPFYLVGNGLGAQIAWFYTAEYPGKVQKLALIDPPGFESRNKGWVQTLAGTPVLNRALWKITPPGAVRLMMEDMYADDLKVTDMLVQRHFDLICRPGNRKAFTDRAQVRDNRPPVDLIDKIKCPTLILWGAEDTRLSPEYAYEFHRRIRGSFLRIYQHTGHWPQEENPEATVRDVVDFWEGRF
ncbi:MAG: alpha/beta hydrolase [Saprospiraceae bacterium]|nr:alpha/beta hydrolase [Saprospiraceae bacterium]